MSIQELSNEDVASLLRDLAAEVESGGEKTRAEVLGELRQYVRREPNAAEMPPRTQQHLATLESNENSINDKIAAHAEEGIDSMQDMFAAEEKSKTRIELDVWEPELSQLLAHLERGMQGTEDLFEVALHNGIMQKLIGAAPEMHAEIAEGIEERREQRREEYLSALRRSNANERMGGFVGTDNDLDPEDGVPIDVDGRPGDGDE